MRYLLIMFILSFSINSSAQKEDPGRERLESKKIAFISDRLNLNTTEAQVFWPVYNDYNNDMKALKSKNEALHKQEEINDEKAKMLLTQSIEFEENILKIKKSYIDKFTQVIGPSKTLQFFRMERRFKQKLLKSFKERKERRKGK